MNKILDAQNYLQRMNADGWLIYDFQGNNPLGCSFLELPDRALVTRRFFYWIPVDGEPVKIVHAIEPKVLDHLPGESRIFLSWESLIAEIGKILKGVRRVAMEYSQNNMIPYVSKVDAGTVDLVRSFGVEVVSSGAFLPHFTAVISKEQGQSHIRAGIALDEIVHDTWNWIADHIQKNKKITDIDVQEKIVNDFKKRKLLTESLPIVATNSNSANPHHVNSKENPISIHRGDFLLIDLWAKEDHPKSIYADITRVAILAKEPQEFQSRIFSIVRKAQKSATELVKSRFSQQKEICGWEVDECARQVIRDAGYGDRFIHRTGHSITEKVHGNGANMDNLEMHDERPILLSTCFSIEPGIYIPEEFGVRLEYDLFVHHDGHVEIVGGYQDEITPLLNK